jgi:hypothetical protein
MSCTVPDQAQRHPVPAALDLTEAMHPAHGAIAGSHDPVLPVECHALGDHLPAVVEHALTIVGMQQPSPACDGMFILGADTENAVEHRAADPTPGRQFSNATADAADFLSALQGLLAALDRGHVHHLHEEPAYLAIDDVGKVTGQRIAHRATVGRRDGALELLRDATQDASKNNLNNTSYLSLSRGISR